ncbi:MAG: tail fiber domain-containing protein [Nitrospirae bacterium]|uniref:tail fiber domain-containing protein n=1 Tax=Candidatus Magnetobacterium casense TaxID=1455061 RepID=UPI00138DE503|nr:tail fiber domain-containing protein [Candidatus Magnetobacterium casensis]MBF0338695.1 tail fiber domain-containing protein [Nitrospirota bacterium]
MDTNGQELMRLLGVSSRPDSGYLGIGTVTPSHPLQMGSGAYVTTGGVWTNASSREYKENIEELSSNDAMLALNYLKPVTFNYKTDKTDHHIGFIAEDVPDIVATKDRKGLSPMDMVALLTKIVQEQQKTIAELSDRVKSLENQTK